MRLIVVAATAALLAGCASTQTTEPAQAAKAPPAKANVVAPAQKPSDDRFANIDASNIAEAQKAGFKVINDNGTPLFCKKEQITGTRAAQRTVCLTAAEMQERARQGQDSMKVHQTPYYGSER